MMKSFLEKINNRLDAQGGFLKSVSILAGGTAFAQIISIIVLPILTRLYSPDDFSVLAVYSSLVALISVIACLRLEIAIPMAEEEDDAVALFLLSLISVVGITILTILGIFLFSNHLEKATDGKLIGYSWLIPLSILFAGLYKALQYWSTRQKVFPLIAKTRISQAISSSGTQLGFGYAGVAPLGLLVGQLASVGSGIVGLSRFFIKNHFHLVRNINIQKLKYVFKKFDRFPKYSVIESFANTGAIQIPMILIAYYAVSAEAGFLMLAIRLLSIPLGLIGGAVAQVYLAESSEKYYQGSLKEFTHNTIWNLTKVGTPPVIIVGLSSPFLVPIVFGESWQRTGILIAWMTPWFLMQFITSPISMAIHVVGYQKLAMYLQVFGLLFRVGMVVFAAMYFNQYIAEFYAVSGVIFYGLYLATVLLILSLVKTPTI